MSLGFNINKDFVGLKNTAEVELKLQHRELTTQERDDMTLISLGFGCLF